MGDPTRPNNARIELESACPEGQGIERFTGTAQVVLEHCALNSARPKVISTV